MHPILFKIGEITVYSYGFCIMLGALAAYFYAIRQSANLGIDKDTVSEMALMLIAAAYIGGKVFLWFSNWDYYMQNPSKMIELSGSGFVFYGSFIFCILSLLIFFRIKKIQTAPMFDILAISTALVHAFGKLGCFFAGCCHGKVCAPAIGVVYNNPLSNADPLHTPLYPVQLMDAAILLTAAILLYRKRKSVPYKGALMVGYVFIYGTGRFFTEFLRGDEERGFIGALSQSQWISLCLLAIALVSHVMLMREAKRHK